MNQQTQISLQRLHTYLERVERDLSAGDRNQALANLAELSEIARRLWNAVVAMEAENETFELSLAEQKAWLEQFCQNLLGPPGSGSSFGASGLQ